MGMIQIRADYTDQDFDSLRERLIVLTKGVFPEWTDFETASFGTTLLELYAFIGDLLMFTQNALARESRLATATQRRNVIALARMLGYRPSGAAAATAVVRLSMESPRQVPVTIPRGTVVRTREVASPVRFSLKADAIILPGETSVEALAENSEEHVRLVDASGTPSLSIALERTPYLDGSASVRSSAGDYTEAESFLSSGPGDRHFVVDVDQDDRATVRFGDGRCGEAPAGTLTVIYRTGGGAAGNVESDRLVVVEGTHRDAAGQCVRLSATNPLPASGGRDRQTVASIKAMAPLSLRTMARSVSREDFEINARRLPGVARALMLTSNEDGSIKENHGILFVVPDGGGVPTEDLLRRVLVQVTETYPCTLTFQVSVQKPVYRDVDIHARVFLSSGASAETVRASIHERLRNFFRVTLADGTPNPNVDFGFNVKDSLGRSAGEIAWSDVFNVIRDTPGVRKVGANGDGLTLDGVRADVALQPREFPALGKVELIDGETEAPL